MIGMFSALYCQCQGAKLLFPTAPCTGDSAAVSCKYHSNTLLWLKVVWVIDCSVWGKHAFTLPPPSEALIVAVVSKFFMPFSYHAVVAEECERPLGHERSGCIRSVLQWLMLEPISHSDECMMYKNLKFRWVHLFPWGLVNNVSIRFYSFTHFLHDFTMSSDVIIYVICLSLLLCHYHKW